MIEHVYIDYENLHHQEPVIDVEHVKLWIVQKSANTVWLITESEGTLSILTTHEPTQIYYLLAEISSHCAYVPAAPYLVLEKLESGLKSIESIQEKATLQGICNYLRVRLTKPKEQEQKSPNGQSVPYCAVYGNA